MYEEGTKIVSRSKREDESSLYWKIVETPKEYIINTPRVTTASKRNLEFLLSKYDKEGKELSKTNVKFYQLEETIGDEDNDMFEVIEQFPWE